MTLRVLLAAFVALTCGMLTSACGGASGRADLPSSYTVEYAVLDGLLGETRYDSAQIVVLDGLALSTTTGLLTHELMHAAGMSASHPIETPGCLGNPVAPWVLLCQEDIDLMVQTAPSGLIDLIVMDATLWGPTLDAAQVWNTTLGRILFTTQQGWL